ncbi:hypothetical protein BCR42DRAFT_418786 [Absidia repens]|uniref:Cytochrome C oxidase copper chaperone-domain-containing protein n=1 Tax=Absidia repens TaxID=90262 RepID=A0A1X2IC20_9FUNG|nr:hypothetical protein BCR42DRAFT_418786 [Absidia repens]
MTDAVKTTSTHSGELPIGKDGKPLKPCCACPDTKKGEEHCQDLIDAHLKCMRDLGFKI